MPHAYSRLKTDSESGTPSLNKPLKRLSQPQVRCEGLFVKSSCGPLFSGFCRSPRYVNTCNLFRQDKGQGETPGDKPKTSERVRDPSGQGHCSLGEAERSFLFLGQGGGQHCHREAEGNRGKESR